MLLAVISLKAQTPIGDLQKRNTAQMEALEKDGYEFRSQIITEFDAENASQDVNIKLNSEYTYLIVALGDSNIPDVDLAIKPESKAKITEQSTGGTGKSYMLEPSKSGKFKISINVSGLNASKKGFISFMVLRK